ncbi:MAG: TatD family hydrolase [Candidatus Omnitrophica bacterium]|nr:TatD family hydrolase [Candidatus Omnitrophota bacterium]
MIDMHCHLDLFPDPEKVANDCKDRKLCILSVTTTPKAWIGTKNLAKGNQKIKTSLGFHPQLAHERCAELEVFDELLSKSEFIGEIGLDGGKKFQSHSKVQKHIFSHILRNVQKDGGRIMSIHSQHAATAVLNELKQYPDAGIPILHWFTGSASELKQAVSQGCWFSVGPAMLASQKGRELFLNMPHDRILTETDGPFAMVNNRPLMPWDVELVFSPIANLWQMDINVVKQKVISNFHKLLKVGRKNE